MYDWSTISIFLTVRLIVRPNHGEKLTLKTFYFMFSSAYFDFEFCKSNSHTWWICLCYTELVLVLVFVPGKTTDINKCWISACIYQRFPSLPDSSLFCSSSSPDLALLAIKCQHLFPYANIITCFRISEHTWFVMHSHFLNLQCCCFGKDTKRDFQVLWSVQCGKLPMQPLATNRPKLKWRVQ